MANPNDISDDEINRIKASLDDHSTRIMDDKVDQNRFHKISGGIEIKDRVSPIKVGFFLIMAVILISVTIYFIYQNYGFSESLIDKDIADYITTTTSTTIATTSTTTTTTSTTTTTTIPKDTSVILVNGVPMNGSLYFYVKFNSVEDKMFEMTPMIEGYKINITMVCENGNPKYDGTKLRYVSKDQSIRKFILIDEDFCTQYEIDVDWSQQ